MAPIYEFKALSPDGKTVKSLVEAETQKTARQKLKKQNLVVVEIAEKIAGKASKNSVQVPFLSGRVGSKDIALMTRQLASLVKANIPLVEALTAVVEQTEAPGLKVIMSQVRQDVNEGLSFAKAAVKHPKVFDTIFVNMIEAGESSGTLGLVLLRLAELKEAQMRLRNKVVSGMTYPALMMFVAVAMMVGIFVFLIPKLTKIFEDTGKPMPTITQFLVWVSDALLTYWPLIIAAVVGTTFMFLKTINSDAGRPKWDRFKLKVPVFGNLIRAVAVTRFAGTMGTLLSSGVPILAAMNIAKNLVGSVPIARAISNARENITEGQSIADPLRRSGEFPPMVIHMIAVGEKTGELPDMLKNVAETYEDQVNARVEQMTALLEPLMIIAMGGVVAFIVISVFMPLLDLQNIR